MRYDDGCNGVFLPAEIGEGDMFLLSFFFIIVTVKGCCMLYHAIITITITGFCLFVGVFQADAIKLTFYDIL